MTSQAVRRLTSKAEIASLLAKPTWSVNELFHIDSASKKIHTSPDEETLERLLKQSALSSAKNDPERRDMLLKELKNQLVFVEHVANVDTEGVQPLVRIGGPAQEFTIEKAINASQQQSNLNDWKTGDINHPTDLAQDKNNKFYVLHEGLRHE